MILLSFPTKPGRPERKIKLNLSRSLRRLISACRYSAAGLRVCFRAEEAFRQEVLAAVFFIPLGLWLGETGCEKILLVAVIVLLMIAELMNSAIERVVDRISLERHELSKEAKDIGSAAVLLALLLAIFTWGFILLS